MPESQWLVYNAGCGWPGFIIFTILMSLPFTLKVIISQLPWYLLFAVTTFTFLFDLRLEVQLSFFYLNIL